jgi:hypothetical protein
MISVKEVGFVEAMLESTAVFTEAVRRRRLRSSCIGPMLLVREGAIP